MDETKPIIGQECICPDGLGRVMSVEPQGSIWIKTYIRNRECCWASVNVELLPLRPQILVAFNLLQADPHQWGDRSCPTCTAISAIIGKPFGCDQYRQRLK